MPASHLEAFDWERRGSPQTKHSHALLARLSPGGKAVFIDYHAPVPWHPLRGFMRQIYDRLEPFAEAMWHHEISDFASEPASYTWRKETYFGGLYQKTVASVAGP